MTVYVDDVRHRFGRMVMCHLWADTTDELHLFAAGISLSRSWFSRRPEDGFEHYLVSLRPKAAALRQGAVLTDKLGPAEHLARLNDDDVTLEHVAYLRRVYARAA